MASSKFSSSIVLENGVGGVKPLRRLPHAPALAAVIRTWRSCSLRTSSNALRKVHGESHPENDMAT
jgi:hypothetical protein